jgi:hypothetical protein
MDPVMREEIQMRTYLAFYRGQKKPVVADTSYAAQLLAAQLYKAKKSYEVTVVLVDTPVDPSSL